MVLVQYGCNMGTVLVLHFVLFMQHKNRPHIATHQAHAIMQTGFNRNEAVKLNPNSTLRLFQFVFRRHGHLIIAFDFTIEPFKCSVHIIHSCNELFALFH